MKKRIKVICSDLDGTLLNSKKMVSKNNLEAIKKWQRKGNLFGITTGRSEPGVDMVVDEEMQPDFVICVNGARVHQLSGMTKIHTLSNESVNTILKVMDQFSQNEYSLTIAGKSIWQKETPFINSKKNELVEKVSAKVAQTDNLKKILADLKLLPFNTTWSDSDYVEVVANGVSKFSGLNEALEEKVSIDEVAAIGDYENDLEIIKNVGLGVAVGNAIPKLKEQADLVVADHDKDAIADLIDKLIND